MPRRDIAVLPRKRCSMEFRFISWRNRSHTGEVFRQVCRFPKPLGTGIQVVYFGGAFSALQEMEGSMGSIVTAQYLIGSKKLTRDQLDKIIAVLDIRDAAGALRSEERRVGK